LAVFLLLVALRAEAAVLPPDVMIARFQGDRVAAVSLTFDDALTSQVDVAIPLLDRYNLKGTFFLLLSNIRPEWSSNWEFWRKAVANGHEAGSHSITHPLLSKVQDPRRVQEEIEGSADRIQEGTGVRPTAFAYPESDFNDAVRRKVLAIYAFDRADCRVWGGAGFRVEDGIRHLEQAVEKKEWFYCMLHGVGETTWGPIDPTIFEGLASYLDSHRDRIWTDTYSRVGSYVRKRNAVNIGLRDVKPDSFSFRLALPDGNEYDHLPPMPLTVKIALDGRDGRHAKGQNNGTALALAVSSCGHYLLADVEPDGSWVQILW
jgi:peptidoglycan/xylan/chitin deacetylase (PgdA/CDA1 family)